MGDWTTHTETNPIDDSETVFLNLPPDHPVAVPYGEIMPTMVVRLMQGKLEVYIDYRSFIGFNEFDVTYRWDKDSPLTESWNSSSDGHSIFSPEPAEFTKHLLKSAHLVVQILPAGGNIIQAEFTLKGLKAGIAPYPKILRLLSK